MSMGGSSKTSTKPNIPPDLQTVLSGRTAMETAQLPSFDTLLSTVLQGGDLRSAPYGSAILAPFSAASDRASTRIRGLPGADAWYLAGRSGQRFAAQESQQASGLSQNVIDRFLAMLQAIPYPTGEETKTSTQPGLLDYLVTGANVASAVKANAGGAGGAGGGGG